MEVDDDDALFHDALESWDDGGAAGANNHAERSVGGTGEPGQGWALHRAAFAGDAEALRQALVGVTPDQLKALDPQGNSALHVAAMCGHKLCVDLLLEAGVPAGIRNQRSWAPVYLALERRDRDLALQLLRADLVQAKAEVKAKKRAVMEQLWQLPDFSTELHWELSSSVPGVGMLLSRYAPHDTYTIWKKGSQIRVDGSLMGVREAGQSLLPEWKRGHFSLLYNGSGGGEGGRPLAVFVNRNKKKYVDLQAARKRMGTLQEGALAKEVDELLAEPRLVKKKVQASGFKFTPVSGWLSKEVTEKVEGWDTKLYEASGNMLSVTRYKAPCQVPPGSSWEDYLALVFPEDVCEQEVISPFSSKALSSGKSSAKGREARQRGRKDGAGGESGTAGPAGVQGGGASVGQPLGHGDASGRVHDDSSTGSRAAAQPAGGGHAAVEGSSKAGAAAAAAAGGGGGGGGKAAPGKAPKKLTGRCWMASGFPLSLQQLLPLLEVVGTTNKHLAKVAKFMAKYGDMDMFPVKIQVPIVFTVYALVQFKKFQVMGDAAGGGSGKPSGLFGRMTSSSAAAPLPPDFFKVPEGFEKYEPKAMAKAEERLKRQGTGEEEGEGEDDEDGLDL